MILLVNDLPCEQLLPSNMVPVLASWNKTTNPEQERLQRYLDKLQADLGPLPADETNLFLHMDIGGPPENYTYQHDPDNYW